MHCNLDERTAQSLRITALLSTLLLCASVVLGQAPVKEIDPEKPLHTPTGTKFLNEENAPDCTKEYGDLASCKSYLELVRAKDKDLLSAFSPGNTAFVCFRDYGDAFFIVTWQTPSAFGKGTLYSKTAPQHEYWAVSLASYTQYRDGVLGDFRAWLGYWKRLSFQQDEDAHISIDNPKHGKLYADRNEIKIGFGYENQLHTTTAYLLSIRRSTGRYQETFTAANKKGDQPTTNEVTGHCLHSAQE
jgi:hypothetical protein